MEELEEWQKKEGYVVRVYDQWMEKEGIPIYRAKHGVEDITELPRRPWPRLGGKGTFIELEGTRACGKQLYVAEIPGGGALEPEKHMYDEIIYILGGRGLTEVWQVGKMKEKHSFEWGEGSLFAIPTNAWHRLVNGGREPVLIFGQSAARLVINTFRNTDFVFNCDYNFTDRYTGQADYFFASASEEGYQSPRGGRVWETNFVPDVRTVGRSVKLGCWNGSSSAEHMPVGHYSGNSHYHQPGAVILGVKGAGYGLVWHRKYGIHPFQDGYGDKVVRVNWKVNGIYTPLSEWFHQHFNTSRDVGVQLKVKGRGTLAMSPVPEQAEMSHISVRHGGTLIEQEDEDPEIRRIFQEELGQKGVKFDMPPVVYRTDPFAFSV